MTKPRICAKKPVPRRMGCAPSGVKHPSVPGEMTKLEMWKALGTSRDPEEPSVLRWIDILQQGTVPDK